MLERVRSNGNAPGADARGALPRSPKTRALTMLAVVCFLDEEGYLPELLASLAAQTRHPDELLLVDDGSSDASAQIAAEFAQAHPWARVLERPPRPAARDRLATAAELQAFQW